VSLPCPHAMITPVGRASIVPPGKVGELQAVRAPLGDTATGRRRSTPREVKVHRQTLGHGGMTDFGR
jgi:hypothetical protein